MATYTKVAIDNILGNPVYGVTPTPTPGYALEFVDTNTRNLTAAMRAFMSATKGISSITKDGETLTITYTDGSTQTEEVKDGQGTGWTPYLMTVMEPLVLQNGVWYYASSASPSVSLTGDELALGDSATVEFITGSSAATFTAPSNSHHAGDSCDGGIFTPVANSHYLIVYVMEGAGLAGYVLRRDV